MRKRTTDRDLQDVYTVERLGRTQEVTPEGFLLCRDVPLARVGEMLYGPGEVPVRPGSDFVARVTRDETVLLAPDTLASFEGKPITLDHPDEDVGPDNWRELARGFVRNVRAGEGEAAGLMLGDLLITDSTAISQVRDGLREVSNGYDAEYEDLGGGRGRQIKITGNHIALVRRGRCGPVCSIGDSEMKTRDKSQKTQDREGWLNRLKAAFYTKDEEAFVSELKGAPDVAEIDGDPADDKTQHITINLTGGAPEAPAAAAATDVAAPAAADPMAGVMSALADIQARLTALEGGGAGEPDGDEGDDGDPDDDDGVTKDSDDEDEDDKKTMDKRTVDSSKLADDFTETLARAEILSPGIKLPTFDARADRQRTVDAMCNLRRRALEKVADEHKDIVAPLVGGADLRKATCDSVTVLFSAASELVRQRTNDRQFANRRPMRDAAPSQVTIASINKRNAEVWAKRS